MKNLTLSCLYFYEYLFSNIVLSFFKITIYLNQCWQILEDFPVFEINILREGESYLSTAMSKVRASQVALLVKNSPAKAGPERHEFDPWVGKIPWGRAWQPTPIFLPGKFHGQRIVADYSPWGHKELDMTEVT